MEEKRGRHSRYTIDRTTRCAAFPWMLEVYTCCLDLIMIPLSFGLANELYSHPTYMIFRYYSLKVMGFLTWHMVGQANHVFVLEGNPSG